MAEVLLIHYNRCLEGCPKKGESKIATKDHVFPIQSGKEHPILEPVVRHRKNIIRACSPHHIDINREKFRSYNENGVSGLVLFIATQYPQAERAEVETLRLEHFSTLFFEVAARIGVLNGDTPRQHAEDYHRAENLAITYAYHYSDLFENRGGFESLRDWPFASCMFKD